MLELDELNSLNKFQKRYLSRRTCQWCHIKLSHPGCLNLQAPCSEETRTARRKRCLQEYHPRLASRGQTGPKAVDYHDFTTKGMPLEDRKKLFVGNYWVNSAKCLICGDTIRSRNKHHQALCSCGKVAVDGGSHYLRFTGDPANFENLSEQFTHVDAPECANQIKRKGDSE